MDRTDRGRIDHWEQLDQLLTDLGCAPTTVLLLDAENGLLYLERCFVGMAVGAACFILKAFDPGVSVAIEDFVSGLATDAKLAACHRHLLAFKDTCNKTKSFIHVVTLIPRHQESPPNAAMCNLCARNKALPMCPKGHF